MDVFSEGYAAAQPCRPYQAQASGINDKLSFAFFYLQFASHEILSHSTAGTATYEKDVTVPDVFLKPGLTARLDFGEGKPLPEQSLRAGMQAWLDAPVREAAVVYINKRRVGSVWCPPYALDVTNFFRPGNNKIRKWLRTRR